MHVLDRKTEDKIADFSNLIIRHKVNKNGTIDKQSFWKLKRALAPKNIEIAHSLPSNDGNDISDPINIKSVCRKEFQHRLRKLDIKPELKYVEKTFKILLGVPKKYTNLKSKIFVLRSDQSVKLVSFVRQVLNIDFDT